MEYIKKEELKDGDIFVSQMSNYHFLNKEGTKFSLDLKTDNTIKVERLIKGCGFSYENIRLATSEEKHWLNTCIEQDKFITFEEAMKTFIPEYVECTKQLIGSKYELGIIYKVSNTGRIENNNNSWAFYKYNQDRFKPSTKEAYDTQFVVKEPEFVLPENWHIVITIENIDIVKKWWDSKNYGNRIWSIGACYGIDNKECCSKTEKRNLPFNNKEITFEQFKKYVLKEETVEEKVIEPLPQFKVIETIETITKVENNEGNQFFIGDIVKSLDSNQKGEIIKFGYSADKSNIIAITTFQSNNGIGIDKIEHYIEPKVEVKETLLEKAKRLYPIGTKFRVACNPKYIGTVKDHKDHPFQDVDIVNLNTIENIDGCTGMTVFYKGKWAEIINE